MPKFAIFFFICAAIFLVYWGYSKGKISQNKSYLQQDYALYHYVQVTEKAIALYHRQAERLPENLTEISDKARQSDREEYLNFLEHYKKFDINYKVTSPSSYEICAHFYKNFSDQALAQTADRFARFKPKKELYKKGHHCFKVIL